MPLTFETITIQGDDIMEKKLRAAFLPFAIIVLLTVISNCIQAQSFYATNTQTGTGADELIIFDFGSGSFTSVGTIGGNLGLTGAGFGGLDWAGGVGNGP